MTLNRRDLNRMKANAEQAAALLRSLGNAKRLLILCTLIGQGELSAGELAQAVDLSASATSQHLARMRDDGLLASRREAQSIRYSIADPNLEALITVLKDLYCP